MAMVSNDSFPRSMMFAFHCSPVTSPSLIVLHGVYWYILAFNLRLSLYGWHQSFIGNTSTPASLKSQPGLNQLYKVIHLCAMLEAGCVSH